MKAAIKRILGCKVVTFRAVYPSDTYCYWAQESGVYGGAL